MLFGPKAQRTLSRLTYYLFFTVSLWSIIVNERNRYATQFLYLNVNTKPHPRAKHWRPVNLIEMKAFVIVLLEMGIKRRPNMFSYWTKNSRSIPRFNKMFTMDRFQLILKFFFTSPTFLNQNNYEISIQS